MTDVQQELSRLAQFAHEREMREALLQLFGKFDQWRRGEMDPFALDAALKDHVEGASRELQARYGRTSPQNAVALAVVQGVIREADLDPDVLASVASQVKYLRDRLRR